MVLRCFKCGTPFPNQMNMRCNHCEQTQKVQEATQMDARVLKMDEMEQKKKDKDYFLSTLPPKLREYILARKAILEPEPIETENDKKSEVVLFGRNRTRYPTKEEIQDEITKVKKEAAQEKAELEAKSAVIVDLPEELLNKYAEQIRKLGRIIKEDA